MSFKKQLKAGVAKNNTCQHLNFKANCNVTRLSEEVGGPITGYTSSLTVWCDNCGMKFRFRGVPAGSDPDYPRASIDGLELRAPLEPASTPKFAAAATYRLPPKQKLQ